MASLWVLGRDDVGAPLGRCIAGVVHHRAAVVREVVLVAQLAHVEGVPQVGVAGVDVVNVDVDELFSVGPLDNYGYYKVIFWQEGIMSIA